MPSTAALLRRAMTAPVDTDDPDAVDRELVAKLAPHVDRACRAWYRLEVRDLERVPRGPALVVGNHNAGTMFLEALGTGARFYVARGTDELLCGLAHDALMDTPGLGPLLARLGAVRAGHGAAARAFADGRKVWVFPGGNREAFRPFRDRYKVDLAGRTGFVRLALRHQVPIVPAVFCGGHSSLVILHDGRRVARWLRADRLLRADTWPLMLALPWGVAWGPLPHVPLPVKCVTRFLEPVDLAGTTPEDADNDAIVADLHRQVVDRMQAALTALAAER